MKDRRTPRGGARNLQAEYLEEYEAELEDEDEGEQEWNDSTTR